MFEKYRTQYIENTTKSELKEYQKQGADIRVKIEELDKNKPMFFGKRIGQKSVKILSESIVKLNTYMTILRTRKRYNAFMINALGVKQ